MGSSTQDHGAPAQVVYHESTIMREHRREEALEHLREATTAMTPEGRLLHAIFGDDRPCARIGSEREPEVPTGRSFGPSHTRRARMLGRIRANSSGLPIRRDTAPAPRPRVDLSPLDFTTRCDLTDLPTPTCAHCQGHTLEED